MNRMALQTEECFKPAHCGMMGVFGNRSGALREPDEDPNKKAKRLSGPVTMRKATPSEIEKYFGEAKHER